jgi:hypothetical protein
MRSIALFVTAVLGCIAAVALAQTPPLAPQAAPQTAPQADLPAQGRFSLSRVDDGVLRLDAQTGQVSHCKLRGGDWICVTAAEDRTALENEIARLQDQVDALKRDIATLREPPLRPPADLNPDAARTPPLALPPHEEIARARAAIENAWRRLVEMVAGFRNDIMRKSSS